MAVHTTGTSNASTISVAWDWRFRVRWIFAGNERGRATVL
jgi:hypothetical protein